MTKTGRKSAGTRPDDDRTPTRKKTTKERGTPITNIHGRACYLWHAMRNETKERNKEQETPQKHYRRGATFILTSQGTGAKSIKNRREHDGHQLQQESNTIANKHRADAEALTIERTAKPHQKTKTQSINVGDEQRNQLKKTEKGRPSALVTRMQNKQKKTTQVEHHRPGSSNCHKIPTE